MDVSKKQAIRAFLQNALEQHGDHHGFTDDESLFLSGRLESFTLMNLVMHLEESLGVDFSAEEFDVGLLDSLDLITAFTEAHAA